jgi:signal transduction histidine kinase
LTTIIKKRKSLHKQIEVHQQEKEQMQFQLGQLQALANIGICTSMIAHEINNLLTPLENYAALALNNPADKELTAKALQKTSRNSARASKVMTSILAMTNKKEEKKTSVPFAGLVEEIFTCLCRDFSKDSITVKIDIPADLTIWAVDIQIQQVIMNLILNARDAMLPKGGILTISARENQDGPENLIKIFEPFFTTKADSKNQSSNSGFGLGLAFCKKVIELHKGSITAESQPAMGSTFKIFLPGSHQG